MQRRGAASRIRRLPLFARLLVDVTTNCEVLPISQAAERPVPGLLQTGWTARTQGARADAKACFVAAVEQAPPAEVLEGPGFVAWRRNETAATFRALFRLPGPREPLARFARF